MKYAATSPPGFFTLVLITGLSVLSQNMFLPSLSHIAEEFQADYTLVSLSVSGYLAITAVLQLIIGPLSDRVGRRPVLLSGLAIFVLASLGCMLAGDIWSFLALRVIQAVIIVGGVLAFAIIRDSASEQEAASQISYVSMAMAVAPMLGPLVGGVLDELFGWRSSFLFFTVLGLAALVLCWIDLGETHNNPSETFMKQFRAYPELLRSRRYWSYTLCMTFSVGAFYIFIAGVPLVAETIFALSPAALGFYMGTITAGFMLGSFLSGRYSKRYPLTTMMIAGRIVACTGLMLGLALFLTGFVSVYSLFGATVFVGLGNGLTMPSANAGALSVRPGLAGSASGLKGAVTIGGAAILTSVAGAVLTEGGGPYQLLGMMLFCSLVGLAAAVNVLRINRSEQRAGPEIPVN
jgi:Bcr/CflA subfamily drug resistance transporter